MSQCYYFRPMKWIPILLLFYSQASAQTLVEGRVTESRTHNYLDRAKISVRNPKDDKVLLTLQTGADGTFSFRIPAGSYRIVTSKALYAQKVQTFSIGKEKVFLAIELTGPKDKTSNAKAPSADNQAKAPPAGFTERGVNQSPAPSPRQLTDPKTMRPVLIADAGNGARILLLPPTFKGYAVELTRCETELSGNSPALNDFKEVFRLKESDGKFTYLIANLGSKDAATAYFKNKIKPIRRSARLVLFTMSGKSYIAD